MTIKYKYRQFLMNYLGEGKCWLIIAGDWRHSAPGSGSMGGTLPSQHDRTISYVGEETKKLKINKRK
jgi:hypothetical protein